MKNSLALDRDVDLYLSMTWPKSRSRKHGVCGHIFEILDYYMLLKTKYNVKILIGEEVSYDYSELITDKYNVTDVELNDIITNTIFVNRPNIIIGDNILFVDGLLKDNFQKGGVRLMFKNIFTFRCTNTSDHKDICYKNVTVLQDKRVYNDDVHAIDYIKKINFDRLRKRDNKMDNVALVYGTGNCRMLEIEKLVNIINSYNYNKYLFVTNLDYDFKHEKLQIIKPPVKDLFDKFETYIYTPTQKNFDCSPRMIAECKYYNRSVLYHDITPDYLDKDTGLRYRIKDMNAGLKSISLTQRDSIFDIIDERI